MAALLRWIRNLIRRLTEPLQSQNCDSFRAFVNTVNTHPSEQADEILHIKCVNSNNKHSTSNATQVPEIPLNIGRFRQLQTLTLTGWGLRSIPWSFIYLKCLKELDLSHNQLASLPNYIGSLDSLEVLNLQDNCLCILPTALLQLKKLKILKLENNELLQGPPYRVCIQGLKAVMDHLEKRSARKNLWANSTAFYDPTFENSLECKVSSLLLLAVNSILDSRLDYLSPVYVPPKLKNFLEETKEERKSDIKVAKCDTCSTYFSNQLMFEGHDCDRALKRDRVS